MNHFISLEVPVQSFVRDIHSIVLIDELLRRHPTMDGQAIAGLEQLREGIADTKVYEDIIDA